MRHRLTTKEIQLATERVFSLITFLAEEYDE
jgi:hypothetical protein